MPTDRRLRESGNALFMILIGIVLFAALSFTFSRGTRQGGESISTRQAELAASDILGFSERAGHVVDSMLRAGKSETDISFEGLKETYSNAACADSSCKVFMAEGTGIQPTYPLDTWIDSNFSADYAYMDWYVTAQFCVPDVPDNTCSPPKGNDLVLVLPYVRKAVCDVIDEKLGISGGEPTLAPFGTVSAAAQFDGSFNPSGGATLWSAAALNGKYAGCVYDGMGKAYYFYRVLIAR